MVKSVGPKEAQLRALREVRIEDIREAKKQLAKAIAEKQLREAVNQSPNESPNAYARNARWRDKNREQYNESQKVLMQNRRKAKAKD